MSSIQARFEDALALHQAGRVDRAAEIYADVLRVDPSHAGAWHLSGVILNERGKLNQALTYISKALSLCDTKAVYWNNYGAVLKELGRFGDARRAFERALTIRSTYPDALSNLGLMQLETGEVSGAERSLLHALQLAPTHADAMRHLAAVRSERGQLDKALQAVRKAIQLAPDQAEAYQVQGNILAAMHRDDEALASYRRALELDPESVETRVSLGFLCSDLNDVQEARRAFEQAADRRPDRPMWRLRHLSLCPIVFESNDAIREYRGALEAELDQALAQPVGFNWRDALRDGFCPSFQLCHHGVCNRRLKEKYAGLFASAFPKQRPKGRAYRRIRVGFLCTHGHQGGFARGLGGIMERLDRQRFELVGLASERIVPYCRERIQSDDVQWVGFPYHLERARSLICDTECDVLMHWQAGTDLLNYFLPFLPLAPIQCIGFGSHGTTGIPNIDYFVSSNLFERDETAAEDYTEELIRFENTTAWQRREPPAEPATRDEVGLPATGTVYLCPQRIAKFQPQFRHLIGRVLDQDSTGVVVVLAGRRGRATETLRRLFQTTLGPTAAQRIKFLPPQSVPDYRRLIGLADLVLDSPCYSASLTGYDAFSQDTPLVTWPGRYMVQRYAKGLYERMGIEELVVSNEDDYVELAVRLGCDADYRQTVCDRIRDRADVLFEDKAAVSEYEQFFEQVVEE